jgi:hypothetical protein
VTCHAKQSCSPWGRRDTTRGGERERRELTLVELRERRDVIVFWRENEEVRRLIKHALERYPDVEAARKQMTDVANRATS